MGVIDDFIARYRREYDYYSEVARLAARNLEDDLQAAGVRAIVTSRPKSVDRLAEKCFKRNATHNYACVDDVYNDIVDLAGVRVALYFPSERYLVDQLIARNFDVVQYKEFPDPSVATKKSKKFSGYSATHYRVRLRRRGLSDAQVRYANSMIEIQVASVLMHAWAEVEHDLVYKPAITEGLSEVEYAILDQLNGLVLAGEIALEQLHRAGEERVLSDDRKMANHYELAALLLRRLTALSSDSTVADSGLGRVDILFDFLKKLDVDTPARLAPHVASLHSDVESRPLADQIADSLLNEDSDRYPVYQEIRKRREGMVDEDAAWSEAVGRFMTTWIRFEALLRSLRSSGDHKGSVVGSVREFLSNGEIQSSYRDRLEWVVLMRNHLVHGVDRPRVQELDDASAVLENVMKGIEERHAGDTPS